MSRRPLLTPKRVGLLVLAVGVAGASWWLFGGRDPELAGTSIASDPREGGGEPGTGTLTATDISNAVLRAPGIPEASRGREGPGRSAPPDIDIEPAAEPQRTLRGETSLRALVAEDRAHGESVDPNAILMGAAAAKRPVSPSLHVLGTPRATPPIQPPSQPAAPPAASPSVSPPATAPSSRPTGAPLPPSTGFTTNADLATAVQLEASDPIRARALITRALGSTTLSKGERERGYDMVNALSKSLFLNTNVNPNDTIVAVYTVQPGDSLVKIVRDQKLACEPLLLKRINGIQDERKIRPNQRLRVPAGTFHAEVVKSEYRLNLYLDGGARASADPLTGRVMIASFRCGLGESNGTPTGMFKVRPRSKLIDPEWTHPKTGEHFAANDPKNPIGDHWIGIVGVEEFNREFNGYGIHGTIEPDSIGQDRSLGCIRMSADDVAMVYECLTEPNSTVVIR